MSLIRSALLYTALALCANAAMADPAALEALKAGDMRKLIVAAEPVAFPAAPFLDEADGSLTLADWQDKVVLVNFWATWCAPCRKEMPALDRLQAEMGGQDFAVVTIATGRNPVAAMRRFFEETGVTNLPLYRDPDQSMARSAAVMGLPVSVLLDREGREVARLMGDAEWDAPEARAVIAALIARP